MAASSDLKANYDVFLSFRGTDVRKSFLSHFYTALAQKGIYSYVDSEELRKGDCIKPALMKAIEESCIAIIIFSEDYASSPWCLEEVEKIMECKEQRGLTVFPVFYKVDPREVRTPRKSYRKAMVKHERKFGRDSEKVKRWKKALLDAGSLSGWDLKDNKEIVISRDLVDSALHYADGLPLALVVLGSYLCGRREHEWESALNKLAKSPDKTINDVLKLSYDGLEDCEKEIFLDIACFFKGQSIEYIMEVLNSCDFDTTIGVEVLVEKSLITKEWDSIQMHDLIQLMGMDIVKQECRDDPRRRSRLWLCEDVHDVLSGDMGTNAVKAIVLVLPQAETIYIGPNAFTNMRMLRLLVMINVHNSFQGPICLPNALRWFQWPECSSSVLEFLPGPKKLVKLDLRKSNIQVVMDQFKDFKNLKFLNFSKCPSVVCMPNLDLTPNLEELDLHGCKNLERAHESVAYHAKLRLLNLKGCSNLYHFLDVLQSKNLQVLNLIGCSKLQRFPDIPDKIKGLEELYLRGTSIEELPTSIENLVYLEKLNLIDCKKLANLPPSIYKLSNLERLILSGCSKLKKFPIKEDLCDPHSKMGFPKLVTLRLEGCNLLEGEFLKNHSCFPRLRNLYLSIHNFAKLPTFFPAWH
ncbi:hypothetical protein EUGRSUZ_A00810 [Eucalyptus grandis]|uniref:TIR domain-containing protein n=2 Tax=Eucalyptus grandis TaxID=71139 RepID=A0A059DDB8_EUCGR|nr:hypothetical protein EUGRSUZ_A00810 [Eucalyptus grandis]